MKAQAFWIPVFVLVSSLTWAELEVGAGISPSLGEVPAGMPEKAAGPLGNVMLSFHGGYSFAWLFYGSADAYVLPPFVVRNLTSSIDEAGFVKEGQYRPGFLNIIDIGIRPKIGPIALSAEVGVNLLYLYKEKEVSKEAFSPSLGVNLRLGGYVFLNDFLSLNLSGTTVFPDIDSLVSTLKAVGGNNTFLRDQAVDFIVGNLYPTIGINLHLGN